MSHHSLFFLSSLCLSLSFSLSPSVFSVFFLLSLSFLSLYLRYDPPPPPCSLQFQAITRMSRTSFSRVSSHSGLTLLIEPDRGPRLLVATVTPWQFPTIRLAQSRPTHTEPVSRVNPGCTLTPGVSSRASESRRRRRRRRQPRRPSGSERAPQTSETVPLISLVRVS